MSAALRKHASDLGGAAEALRANGLWAEALVLEEPGLLAWAQDYLAECKVLTAEHSAYPKRWVEVLGASAPPALWLSGEMPAGPFIGVVGSRKPSIAGHRFAVACAKQAVELGYAVVSGGAAGCDAAAVRSAASVGGRVLEILPGGLPRGEASQACRISLCEPATMFSDSAAMERNTLIYALSNAVVVAHARYREGGSWHGAVYALRRRLTQVIVRRDEQSQAMRALAGLGATAMGRAECLETALASQPSQGCLPHAR